MDIIEKAPAKINLGFDVIAKRTDGYHDIETIMTSIDLADYLTFSLRQDQQINIETENSFLPLNEDNHIYQAVQILQEDAKISNGVNIYLKKRIPVAAGLAGGSSDAAATLRGLNRLWQLDYSLEHLARLGAKIGSDVPFCIYGKTAKATGIGTELEFLPPVPQCWVVLIKPNISISTSKIFQSLCLEELEHPKLFQLEKAILAADFTSMCECVGNSLESVTLKFCNQITTIKNCLFKMGASAVVMSGTGPTMLALCQKRRKAEQIVNGVKGFCDEVYIVRTIK